MNKIRALRHKLGLNLTDFAKLIGTQRITISTWEHDYNKVSEAYKALIREKTGYDLDTLQEAGEGDGAT
jgi:DNA-binding transcriptional regulator YiaG